ncbi:DNA-binding transcriptional regulator, MarR family [Monaibacterium marinum]|uniref:DNA-binding transcriptional regulator, MarR family n=1 Tax=Pontivivens marinum TaxID=1690039 RepID=A0A2C9CQU5_9RHOB|nr:MarR family transcriptional regulator [Monaibacterium marinum]SOH93921.1 DNA-binding transcriptional regulator, MarR family [Monaibacterium marinum]
MARSTDLPRFDLAHFLPYRLSQVANQLSCELQASYEDAGLTTAQWRVMVHLSQSESVSVRDIEQQVSLEKSKVSRAAAHLQQRGLVGKGVDRSDGRLVALRLTDAGRELMAQLLPKAIAFQSMLEAKLGAEAENLHRAIDTLQG